MLFRSFIEKVFLNMNFKERRNMKTKIWFWIVTNIFRVNQGDQYPKFVRILYRIIFPVQSYIYENTLKIYNQETDFYTIENVKISGAYIRTLSPGKSGQLFVVRENLNGVIVVELVRNSVFKANLLETGRFEIVEVNPVEI